MFTAPGGISDKAVFVHSNGGGSRVECWLSQSHGLVNEDIRNPNHLGHVRVERDEGFVWMFVTVRQTVIPDLYPLVSPVHPEGGLQRHGSRHFIHLQHISQVYREFYIHWKLSLWSWRRKVLILLQ